MRTFLSVALKFYWIRLHDWIRLHERVDVMVVVGVGVVVCASIFTDHPIGHSVDPNNYPLLV
jgi:hypothetical protein